MFTAQHKTVVFDNHTLSMKIKCKNQLFTAQPALKQSQGSSAAFTMNKKVPFNKAAGIQ